jgi:hypothetical protein
VGGPRRADPHCRGLLQQRLRRSTGITRDGSRAWLERGADRRGHEIRHRTGTTRSSHSVISPLRQRRGAYQLDRLGECGIKRIRTRTGCYVGHHTAIFRRKCRPSLYRAKTQGRLGCPEFRRHLQRSTCSFVRGAARQEQSPGGDAFTSACAFRRSAARGIQPRNPSHASMRHWVREGCDRASMLESRPSSWDASGCATTGILAIAPISSNGSGGWVPIPLGAGEG